MYILIVTKIYKFLYVIYKIDSKIIHYCVKDINDDELIEMIDKNLGINLENWVVVQFSIKRLMV